MHQRIIQGKQSNVRELTHSLTLISGAPPRQPWVNSLMRLVYGYGTVLANIENREEANGRDSEK